MGETETNIVVAVVRVVPVTVGRTQVVLFVVPGTTAQNTGSVRSVPVEILSLKKYFYASPRFAPVWHGLSSFARGLISPETHSLNAINVVLPLSVDSRRSPRVNRRTRGNLSRWGTSQRNSS